MFTIEGRIASTTGGRIASTTGGRTASTTGGRTASTTENAVKEAIKDESIPQGMIMVVGDGGG